MWSILLFFSGGCLETEVSEQLYYKKNCQLPKKKEEDMVNLFSFTGVNIYSPLLKRMKYLGNLNFKGLVRA
jgi:hypothetical protein